MDGTQDGTERDDLAPGDARMLAELAGALGGDPLPEGLVERAAQLIELQDLGHELAHLLQDAAEPVGVRSAGVPGEPSPTLTFESADGDVSLDVDVTASAVRGQVHADGEITVALQVRDGVTLPLPLDSFGRFALPRPTPGVVRLRVVLGGARRVVTDWFVV